jgi:peroxin-11B
MSICREKYNAQYQFMQDAVDTIIPSSALGIIKADEGIVGLAG